MILEIGSDFQKHNKENGKGLALPQNGSYVFSGRTAFDAVLNYEPKIESVLLPSYCCDSMLVPFKEKGICIKFYDVNFDEKVNISITDSADALVWCDYFGFHNDMPEYDGLVIEDITHSYLSVKQFHERSDFLVASLRKWEPILCGGYTSVNTDYPKPPEEFLKKKMYAMELKNHYLETLNHDLKDRYLELFKESNQWLANHYSEISTDDYSLDYIKHVDIEKQRSIRRKNAFVLYEGLGDIVQFMFPEDSMDCPLFVPIILNGNRDYVRQHLIDNDIYCPVHWPHPEANCESNLYDIELSLICDQRYSELDMERIVSVVKEAL